MTQLIRTFILILFLTLLTACSGAGGNTANSESGVSVAQTEGGQSVTGLSIAYSIKEVESEVDLSVDDAAYQIHVTYENKTTKDIVLAFPTSSLYKEYRIIDNNNDVIVDSDTIAFDTQLTFITVPAGDTVSTSLDEQVIKNQASLYQVSTTVRYFINTDVFILDISSQF